MSLLELSGHNNGLLKRADEPARGALEIIERRNYTLEPTNRAEEVAVSLLDRADVVVNVIDATSLERCLLLTVELLEKRKPMSSALKHVG